jgi:hypothetical protein
MNNVASPVVVVSIVQPMLNELSAKEVYSKALLLGIAYSNNIGGMTVRNWILCCSENCRLQSLLRKTWWLFIQFKTPRGTRLLYASGLAK